MTKRPRERDGEHLKVLVVDAAGKIPPVYDSLASFIFPMTAAEFMDDEFRRRAVAFKVHPKMRERRLSLLFEAMDGFKPMPMLEQSNSEFIHVWMQTQQGAKSIKTDAAQAKTCFDAGHPLYFRASELLEGTLLPAIARDLHFGFAANHRDGNRRGEIETFVAKPGHVTRWHFDFQENFTVQLKGSKKWSFYRSQVANPFRACATHFDGKEYQRTLHTQFQTIRASNAEFVGIPDDIEEKCESVVLQEGDVLYHPAGVWHKVEVVGEESSVSINLSFFPQTWGELIAESLTQSLLSMPSLRERISYKDTADAQKTLTSMLQIASSRLNAITANDILPVAVTRENPAHIIVTWDSAVSIEGITVGRFPGHITVRRNPLAVLSSTPESLAFPVPIAVIRRDDATEDSDEDEQDAAEEVTTVAGMQRFDLTANFLAEDGGLRAPAVTATFFVSAENEKMMNAVALLGPRLVSASELKLPQEMIDILVATGYLSPSRV
jgi:quercetin dioxygenase-like cupin family protein